MKKIVALLFILMSIAGAATSALYLHHERSTQATTEADCQNRELCLDKTNLAPLGRFNDGTLYHLVTQEKPNVNLTGTLGVTGSTTLSSGLTISTLSANRVPYTTTGGLITQSANLSYDGTTLGVNNTTVSGTSTTTGVATFTAAPVFNSATASLPMFTNGSKALVSNAMTGTGSVMMSVSPASTGTATFVNTTNSGTLAVTGATTLTGTVGLGGAITNNNTYTTATYNADGTGGIYFRASNGVTPIVRFSGPGNASPYNYFAQNTIIGTDATPSYTLDVRGTLGVNGATTLASTLAVAGDIAINTNKFTVAAASGNTLVAGTLGITGLSTFGKGVFTSDFTLGSSSLVAGAALSYNAGSGAMILTPTTFSVAAAATITSTLAVTGATTLSSTLGVTGLVTASANLVVQGNYIKLPLLSSHPASPAQGWMYFNTTSGHGVMYNGTSWVEFA